MTRLKQLLIFVSIVWTAVSCTQSPEKVLLFVRDGSADLDYMLRNEVLVMKEILEQSGFQVEVTTQSGALMETDSASLMPDVKLSDVQLDQYAGVLFPCMASDSIPEEAIELAQQIAKREIPFAAQLGSVRILAEAGVLDGKNFAYSGGENFNQERYPEFQNAVYGGTGIVQDGSIITSGSCPWMAFRTGAKDETREFTRTFVSQISKAKP